MYFYICKNFVKTQSTIVKIQSTIFKIHTGGMSKKFVKIQRFFLDSVPGTWYRYRCTGTGTGTGIVPYRFKNYRFCRTNNYLKLCIFIFQL